MKKKIVKKTQTFSAKKKKSFGSHPLLQYLAPEIKKQTIQKQTLKKEAQIVPATQIKTGLKQRITLHLSVELIDRVKNAVYWEPGLTIAGFAEKALEKAIDKMEKEKGASYPTRHDYRLKGGRPIR